MRIHKTSERIMDDVIEIQKPDPDGHYRLIPCERCFGDNVAYVHYNGRGGAAWRVTCFDCGHTIDKGNKVKHDAQLNWNEGNYGRQIS